MPPTFFGCLPRQKIDQKRHLSSRLSRIHFCDLIHGGGLVFVLYVIVASLAGRDLGQNSWLEWHDPISTHASLAGRDADDSAFSKHAFNISTHASLAGRDF